MKERKYFFHYFFIFSFLSIFLISDPVIGNGPVGPETYREPLIIVLLIFMIGPLIESMIAALFLKKNETIKTRLYLILFVLLINILTVPLTQFLVTVLSYITTLFLLAELFPLIAEFMALFSFFNYYHKIKNRYSIKYIFLIALISNIFTMIIGLILLYGIKS